MIVLLRSPGACADCRPLFRWQNIGPRQDPCTVCVFKNETWTEEMAYNMMYRSPIIHVVHPYYTNEYMHTLEIGVEAYVKGVFPTEELITHRIPFERVDEGFRLLDTNPPGYIKGIITF